VSEDDFVWVTFPSTPAELVASGFAYLDPEHGLTITAHGAAFLRKWLDRQAMS
jgi:hypothetical protein